jgi:hypothetical protein
MGDLSDVSKGRACCPFVESLKLANTISFDTSYFRLFAASRTSVILVFPASFRMVSKRRSK